MAVCRWSYSYVQSVCTKVPMKRRTASADMHSKSLVGFKVLLHYGRAVAVGFARSTGTAVWLGYQYWPKISLTASKVPDENVLDNQHLPSTVQGRLPKL